MLRLLLCLMMLCSLSAYATTLPDPAQDVKLTKKPGNETIVLAGGCFWGVQAVFQHVKGVEKAVSGYAGGEASTAHYNMVSTGETGHAESVEVTYDPSKITLGKILKVYFSVAHDPTMLNYQGPDQGTQYRSAIFYATPEQQKLAEAYIAQLKETEIFPMPIVTTLEPLQTFYPAEEYHQDYLKQHPYNPYIMLNDQPKLDNLQKEFPKLYVK